jgi:DNA-binding response OmpR family regulator
MAKKENQMAKILVVDDDPDVTQACQLVLKRAGHEVQEARSRQEGMSGVESFKPDLLILDVMMVESDDGIAMARELRQGGFRAPILMLTNIGKVSGMAYGKDDALVPVDEFVEKPVSPATLVEKVNNLLGKKEAK